MAGQAALHLKWSLIKFQVQEGEKDKKKEREEASLTSILQADLSASMLLHLDLNFSPRSEQIRSCFHIWQKYYSPVNRGGVAPAFLSGEQSLVFSNQQHGVHRGLPVLTLISTSGSSSLHNPTSSPSLLGSETQKASLKIPENVARFERSDNDPMITSIHFFLCHLWAIYNICS